MRSRPDISRDGVMLSGASHLSLPYLRKYAVGRTFVETGTYKGDTVQLALDFGFEKIHSIELNPKLHQDAVSRFAGVAQVCLWLGDSVDVLPRILAEIREEATFWFDAHASGVLPGGKEGQTPLLSELDALAAHPVKTHAIFIDDRRLLGSAEWDYLQEDVVLARLHAINPDYRFYHLDGAEPGDVLCAAVPRPGGFVTRLAGLLGLPRRQK